MSKKQHHRHQLKDLYIEELGKVTGGGIGQTPLTMVNAEDGGTPTTILSGEEEPSTTWFVGEEGGSTTHWIGEEG